MWNILPSLCLGRLFLEEGVVQAVENVSFEVYPGEILNFVGESGCGKSVTGLFILRLIPSPPGRIVSERDPPQ